MKTITLLLLGLLFLSGCASDLDARIYRLQQAEAIRQQEIRQLEHHLERVQNICEKAKR